MKFIVFRPVITETSMKDAHNGKFTFLVDTAATKTEIRREIENIYGVKVIGISTINMRSTKVIATRFGRKNVNKKTKKARVSLLKGQSIPAFEIPEEGKKEKKKEEKGAKKE